MVCNNQLELAFGPSASYEFVDIVMSNGEMYSSTTSGPDLFWKSYRACVANMFVQTPRVFDGWIPSEEAQIRATSANVALTATGLLASCWMRESGEDLDDFEVLSCTCSASALLRPSMVWLALPEGHKERSRDVAFGEPCPCLLAHVPPPRPPAEVEGFIIVEGSEPTPCLDGASLGWHTLQRRRPGI